MLHVLYVTVNDTAGGAGTVGQVQTPAGDVDVNQQQSIK